MRSPFKILGQACWNAVNIPASHLNSTPFMRWFLLKFRRYRELEMDIKLAIADAQAAQEERERALAEADAATKHSEILQAADRERSGKVEELSRELQESENRAMRLQDRLDAALEDRGRLWDLVEQSISKMECAYQMHVNVEWQKAGRGAPYPDAPQIPADRIKAPVADSMVPRPRTGSEQVAARTAAFIREYTERKG